MDDEEKYESSGLMTRAEAAYNMKVRGMPLVEIAEELHIEPNSVSRLILERLGVDAREMPTEDKQTLLALENARTEAVLRAHWAAMEMGDPKSSDIVLKAIALRVKMNKLDIPDATVNQNTVLVIGGMQEDYIEKLKALGA